MAEATGVRDNDWNVAKINSMPHRRFNPDFHRDADYRKGTDAAIPQRDVQRRALKRRHGDLVEGRLARKRGHFRNQMESRSVPQEPVINGIALACASTSVLEDLDPKSVVSLQNPEF